MNGMAFPPSELSWDQVNLE